MEALEWGKTVAYRTGVEEREEGGSWTELEEAWNLYIKGAVRAENVNNAAGGGRAPRRCGYGTGTGSSSAANWLAISA